MDHYFIIVIIITIAVTYFKTVSRLMVPTVCVELCSVTSYSHTTTPPTGTRLPWKPTKKVSLSRTAGNATSVDEALSVMELQWDTAVRPVYVRVCENEVRAPSWNVPEARRRPTSRLTDIEVWGVWRARRAWRREERVLLAPSTTRISNLFLPL